MNALQATPQQKAARDNPWYRLATLHGEPATARDERAAKNCETWNRWMAPRLSDAGRGALRQRTGLDHTPFSEAEQRLFDEQVGSSLDDGPIDFSNTRFEAPFFVEGFVFLSVSFERAIFSGEADFESAIFSEAAVFRNATFSGITSFNRATFSGEADFESAIFSTGVGFNRATFSDAATFDRATFSDHASFIGTTFSTAVYLRDATFSSTSFFQGATFGGFTVFERANFSQNVYFQGATFSYAIFRGAIFGGIADFQRTTFNDATVLFERATFRYVASFVNAEMKSPTTFDNARFSEPPRCFNAKLHEGTTWHGVVWPETPKDVKRARQFIDAYERLKLEMDKLKKHEDELKFFALEQQCRRVVDGFWKGLPIAMYGCLSNYGRSYVRPLGLIVAVWLVGAFLMALHLVGFWAPIPGYAFFLSIANTFSVLGIRREFINLTTVQLFPLWLTVVAAVQSILGIVLLFLFGLGIRNRFRIK
jgi:uncharacterized protein YjbI with pentapeptide repeats